MRLSIREPSCVSLRVVTVIQRKWLVRYRNRVYRKCFIVMTSPVCLIALTYHSSCLDVWVCKGTPTKWHLHTPYPTPDPVADHRTHQWSDDVFSPMKWCCFSPANDDGRQLISSVVLALLMRFRWTGQILFLGIAHYCHPLLQFNSVDCHNTPFWAGKTSAGE